jgi:hypothetical protein
MANEKAWLETKFSRSSVSSATLRGFADRGDAEGLASVFMPDGVLSVGDGNRQAV